VSVGVQDGEAQLQKAPPWYQRARRYVGEDRRCRIDVHVVDVARESSSWRGVLGTVVPTFVLAAQTQGDVGLGLPIVTGVVAFGVVHIGLNKVMEYAPERARLLYEVGVDREVLFGGNLPHVRQENIVHRRMKRNQCAADRLNRTHFLAASFLTAVMSVAAVTPLADAGMKRVQGIFADRDGAVQVDVNDALLQPVSMNEHNFLVREI